MNQASGAGVAASGSSSAQHRAASSGAGAVAQDEQILSAFRRLRLHPSQADPQRGQASALDTSSFGPTGPGRTSPSTISRLPAGRGRGRTLPAWMTSGDHAAAVPGGLRQQVPRDSGARAGPAGLSSSSTQKNSQGGQQADPSVDTSFQLGIPNKGKHKSKKKKKQQQSATTSPGTAEGANVHGGVRAEPARQPGLAPASEPSAGIWMAGPTAAAPSPRLGPRWTSTAVGSSGLGTIPAAVPKGVGLQEKAPPLASNATAQPQRSRQTGLYSSRPQQSAQSGQRAPSPPGDNKSNKYTYDFFENQAAGGCTHHAVPGAGLPESAPPATVTSNRAPTAGLPAAGGGRGRERTLPAWMTSAAQAAAPGGLQHPLTAVPPGGLQQQPPHGGGVWTQVPRATASNFYRAATYEIDRGDKNIPNKNKAANTNRQHPQQHPQHPQQQPTTGGGIARKPGKSETATASERSPPPPKVERGPRGIPGAAPRRTLTLNSATGGEGHATGRAGFRQATSTTGGGSEPSDMSSKPKRSRDDEEPAEDLLSGASTTTSHDFGVQHTPSFADPVGVGGRMGGHGSGPRSKKNKATLSESKPAQKLVATRSRFKIVHHHAIPQEGKIVVATRGQSSHPGPSAAGEDGRATNASTNTNANANANAGIESNLSGSSHGRAPLPAKPSARAAANKTPAGSALSVVIDGSEAAFSHREAKGGWSAMGPLLAIQFFEERGVDCVAFLPRQRVDSIAPQSVFYPTFLRARGSGAIASVPAGTNSRLFILKHALDKKAFVVTNDWLHDLAGRNETLAALGQTEAELRAYLSRHQVSFTFARNQFVPDPETPLVRMLTQAAAAKRVGNEASRTTAGVPSSGPPSFPLPRPPPGLSGRRDNPTPSMLRQNAMR